MNVTQLENSYTFTERLPQQTTIDRLEQVITDRRRELILLKNRQFKLRTFDSAYAEEDWQASDERKRLVNQITQSESRLRRIKDDLIEIARLIVAESDNEELI